MSSCSNVMKRVFDLLISLLLLLVLSPLLLVIVIGVAVNLGRPVLFRQQRGGYRQRSFDILKFRTMTNVSDDAGRLLPDEERLTGFGRFLRSSSLDELPALLNVIRGDMSLVGPRPFIYDYVSLYTPEQARRHEVRPGITGWAQVHGRNTISWEEKFVLDVWYVDHRSLWLDVRIIVITVMTILRREGVDRAGYASGGPSFLGTPQNHEEPKNEETSCVCSNRA